MAIQDILLKFMLKEFEAELNKPGSALNKKYKTELTNLFNGGGLDVNMKGVLEGAGAGTNVGGNGQTPDQAKRDQFYEDNKRRTRDVVLDNALSGIGEAAEATGGVYNIYNSLLGDALLAVSQGIGSQGYDNPLSMMPAAALAYKAKGGAGNIVGGAVNKVFKNIVNDRRGTDEANRNLKTLTELNPPGAYYDAGGRAMKIGQSNGRN